MKNIWNLLFAKLNTIELNTTKHVVFGAMGKKHAMNMIIICTKQYIVQCKLSSNATNATFAGVKSYLNYHVDIERRIAASNNKLDNFSKKWLNMLDGDGRLKL